MSKEIKKEYFKNYYDKNKTKMNKYNKRYYNKHKKYGQEIIKCKICGEEIMKSSLYGHIKSKLHNIYLTSLEMDNRSIADCI
jgi:hypothetical protein